MTKRILALLLALAFIGCASMETAKKKKYEPEMVQHFKGSIFTATDTGYYTAELIIRPRPPVVGKNSADLIIHDWKAHDIEGLGITVTPYMAEKGTPSPDKVTVKDAGRGLYILENLNYNMPGQWELRLDIRGPEDDTVVLKLPEVK